MDKERCAWCGDEPIYVKYHDEEWGKPCHNDATIPYFDHDNAV